MRVVCPECGSEDVRFSRERGLAEKLRAIVGIHPVRCRDCRHRYNENLWRFSTLMYAHCPRCYRGDLGLWSLDEYRPRLRQRLLLGFGAKPYRCKACRTHFVSFRPRRRNRRRADSVKDPVRTQP
jgi:Zn finger protein HypA/HybF involved in hydrogenase expression